MNSGTTEIITTTQSEAITHRCDIDHASIRPYGFAVTRKSHESLLEWPSFLSTFRNREHSIGVSVKLTSSDTMMANAAVYPKLDINLPTIPLISATGMKMITRLKVVASTASPISRVP